jgi:hypothetical protein
MFRRGHRSRSILVNATCLLQSLRLRAILIYNKICSGLRLSFHRNIPEKLGAEIYIIFIVTLISKVSFSFKLCLPRNEDCKAVMPGAWGERGRSNNTGKQGEMRYGSLLAGASTERLQAEDPPKIFSETEPNTPRADGSWQTRPVYRRMQKSNAGSASRPPSFFLVRKFYLVFVRFKFAGNYIKFRTIIFT